VLNVRTTTRLGSISTARVLAGRRVRAARLLAGGPTLRSVAADAGLDYAHLSRVERGEHPLLDTDARDLGRVLDVPEDWLLGGWR
jgi:transcriptional regulator with XRE-family HTH domain